MGKYNSVTEMLLSCETNGMAHHYGDHLVKLDARNEEIVVVSDFHICSGLTPDKTYTGTENFFADGSFLRFLEHIGRRSDKRKTLVINGDFLDFLRNVLVPKKEEDFVLWKRELAAIGVMKSTDELRESIVDKELTYGLKTDDYKSVWKFITMVDGHIDVFQALGNWLNGTNRLVVLKGNHDLEFYWPAVRNYFRLTVAREIRKHEISELMNILEQTVLPNIFFIDDKVILDGEFYVEHGHRYDKYSRVVGGTCSRQRHGT